MRLKVNKPEKPLFTLEEIHRLIIPLVLEQLLLISVGLVDTLMVASAGEAAVSGVSLIDSINMLIIMVFSALSTGGAVVVTQYLGRNDDKNASRAAAQLLYIMVAVSGILALIALLFRENILSFVFGKVDDDVMQNALIYFLITAAAYPLMGIYNAGSALFRAIGNSRISMWCALIVNIINIGINAVLIYGFNMGAAGAGIGTFISRVVVAIFIFNMMRRPDNRLDIKRLLPVKIDSGMMKSILSIGIPNGIENGMFHIGKLLVLSLITGFGTAAVAANAVANSIASVACVPGSAIGLAIITVAGRCMGAGETGQARYYTRKMMIYGILCMGSMALFLIIMSPYIVPFFNLSDEAFEMAVTVIRICSSGYILLWPLSFILPNSLRAAGDAVFTMIVSQCSMFIVRVAVSYVFACEWGLGMGLSGVWLAMVTDWVVRAIIFTVRYEKGKWEKLKVID